MLTVIVLVLLVTGAVLLSAWLLIRQVSGPKMSRWRTKLMKISLQAREEISQAMNSNVDELERLRRAIKVTEVTIARLDELELDHSKKITARRIYADLQFIQEIELVRVCIQDMRIKLLGELSSIS